MLLTACGQPAEPSTDEDIYRLIVTIPARAPTTEAGELEAFIYADEPLLEDMHDDLLELDAQVVRFTHRQGAPTKKAVTLTGEVPRGHNVGVHVLGFERRGGAREQVLWDGQDGTELALLSGVTLRLLPDETPEADALESSLHTWQEFKEANGGAYCYEVGFSSMIGEYGKTTFEVRDDRVVMRAFERRDAEAGGEVVESWTEWGDELGSHGGYEPLTTVEELYAVCRDEVLTRDRFENDIEVDYRDDGVLKFCLYTERHFADAVGTGARIDDLRFLADAARHSR